MSDSKPGINFGQILYIVILALVFYAASERVSPLVSIPLLIPLGFVCVLYVLAPIKTYNNQRLNPNPRFDRIDPDSIDLPRAIRAEFDRVDAELDDAGFAPVAAYRTTNLMANAESYVALYRDPHQPGTVKFLGTLVGQGNLARIATLTVLETEFSDGTVVATSDSRVPSIFPRMPPPIHSFAFPEVRELAQLVAIHRGLVRRFDAGRTRRDSFGAADPIEYLHRTEFRGLTFYRTLGYYREVEREDGGTLLRPSAKGALLMTWRLLPPWKQIRRWRRQRFADRTLRELREEGAAV